jgi:phytoene dehydrogenase-like protein
VSANVRNDHVLSFENKDCEADLQTANIIGSGPNGLAAAITLAQRGVAVTVYERNGALGGACSTAEVTAPGFLNDLGSSVYPLGIASPFFRSLPLEEFGLRWIEPSASVAHPIDDETAITLEHSIEATVAQFNPHDAKAWQRLFTAFVKNWPKLVSDFTRPLLRIPSHPIAMGRFGLPALLPADMLARTIFRNEAARALFAGIAAHSVLPLTRIASSATGIVLATAGQTTGWPIAAGGAQAITNALAGYLKSIGGKIRLDQEVKDICDLPNADITLFDTSVSSLARIAGSVLSSSYLDKLGRFKPGPGIFKIDYALSSPIPWRNPACSRAATVHLGGTLPEIAQSEHDAFYGRHSDRPFVLLVQPSLFDPTRAPKGQHTAWAYCHVPTGSTLDRTAAIEAQIARFAPGFQDVVIARRTSSAADLATWNPNLKGGDVSGGAMTLTQLLFRPTIRGYRTSNPALYLCSSSTPPGGGVHGICGHLAALAAYHYRLHTKHD